jgi:hypothetical protein
VRTHAAIPITGDVAIEAKHPISVRPAVLLEPSEYLAQSGTHLPAMRSTILVDVINRQHRELGFAAASANDTSVLHKSLSPESGVSLSLASVAGISRLLGVKAIATDARHRAKLSFAFGDIVNTSIPSPSACWTHLRSSSVPSHT